MAAPAASGLPSDRACSQAAPRTAYAPTPCYVAQHVRLCAALQDNGADPEAVYSELREKDAMLRQQNEQLSTMEHMYTELITQVGGSTSRHLLPCCHPRSPALCVCGGLKPCCWQHKGLQSWPACCLLCAIMMHMTARPCPSSAL